MSALAVVMALGAGAALAQAPAAAFDARTFRPAVDAAGLPALAVAEVLPHGVYAAGLTLDFALNPLRVSAPDAGLPAANIVERRLQAQLTAGMGIAGRFELGVALPVVLYQGGLDSPFARETLGFEGLRDGVLGDVSLQGRAWVLPQGRLTPALSAGAAVSLPTGDAGALAGEASWVVTPFVSASRNLGPHVLAASVGYRYRQKPLVLRDTEIDDQLSAQLGLVFMRDAHRVDKREALVFELDATTALGQTGGHEGKTSLEALVGFRNITPGRGFPLSIGFGAGAGILRAPGTPIARIFLTFDYMSASPYRDSDGDARPDRRDWCAGDAEDFDGYADQDGCADPDNDADGVPDEDDECPDVASSVRLVGLAEGCPAPDEPDRDEDGIIDRDDACPDAAEDMDGFEDWNGCPEADNDGDGLTDLGDLCPEAAEDANRFEDDDGCPDGGKGARLVEIEGARLALLRPLKFDPGTATLKPGGDAVLDQAGSLLRDRHDVEIIRVVVYPARKGKRAREDAKARAWLVMKELARRGIETSRLMGDDRQWDARRAEDVEIELVVSTPRPARRRR